jgi:multicomponent Na+:H+ antiporter subunit B
MAVAATALGALYVWGAAGLPDFGDTVSVTGTTITHAAGSDRQVTNAVSAIVFDYRGFDTFGEELILFVSVVAVALLLRAQRDQEEPIAPDAQRAEEAPGGSDAVRLAGLVAIGVTFLLGLYVIAHGQLTPGGGFQGGAILGSALVAIYAAGDMATLREVRPRDWLDVVHALGAAGLIVLALGGLVAGGAFFHNFLPTGHSGSLLSGGTIGLDNVAVGLEVVGATALLVSEVLQDTMVAHRPGGHA